MTEPLRVLLVEDSSAMRAFVRAALEAEGDVEVSEAAGGFDALRILPRQEFQLVIVDINMPDINGLEVLSFIRNSPAHSDIPVILISTEASSRDKERGLALGANDFISKPFMPAALIEALRRLRPNESAD